MFFIFKYMQIFHVTSAACFNVGSVVRGLFVTVLHCFSLNKILLLDREKLAALQFEASFVCILHFIMWHIIEERAKRHADQFSILL